jgi:hypothetical protein
MKKACAYLMSNKTVVAILVAWVVFLMMFALFYGTSGLKEGIDSMLAGAAPVPAESDPPPGTPVGLVFFQNNRAGPEFCNPQSNRTTGAYSDSRGCLELTEDQLKMLSTRGGNRTSGLY